MYLEEKLLLGFLATIALAAVLLLVITVNDPKSFLRNGDYCLITNGQPDYDHCLEVKPLEIVNSK